MQRLIFLSALFLLVFCSINPQSFAESKENPSVVGTWKLEKFLRVKPDGAAVSWCKGVNGFLTYTNDGHVSVGINCDEDTPGDSPSSYKNSMLFYLGTYSINGNKITHHISNASSRSMISKDLVRTVEELNSEILLLTGDSGHGAFKITWKRSGAPH